MSIMGYGLIVPGLVQILAEEAEGYKKLNSFVLVLAGNVHINVINV